MAAGTGSTRATGCRILDEVDTIERHHRSGGADEQAAAEPGAAATACDPGRPFRHGVLDGEIVHRDLTGLNDQAAISGGFRRARGRRR